MDAAEATVLSTQEGKEKNISPVKEALELGGLLFFVPAWLGTCEKVCKNRYPQKNQAYAAGLELSADTCFFYIFLIKDIP